MTLQTTLVSLVDTAGVSVPGYTSWPVAVLPHEASIAKVAPANMVAYFSPGRRPMQSLGNMREQDACLDSRVWAAQSAITLAKSPAVLGGLPRAVFSGGNGFITNIDAPLVDYSLAVLARTSAVTGIKALLNVGSVSASRILLYITADDIALQHGTGDVKTSTGSTFVADGWMPLIVSYKNSDKSIRVYANSTTPIINTTMTNSPPAAIDTGIGSLYAGGQQMAGEIALAVIWNTPLHDDSAAVARLMSAMQSIVAL